ncbi:hypothetical protein TNCV_573061 [Trichonephila clavipes]|nr:hypothetical protein TNCV_573061 [Trichonephila clavipes]
MLEKEPVPKNFEELSKAVLSGKYKCLTPAESMDRALLLKSGVDYMAKLGDIIEKNDWKYSYAERFEDLLDDPVALVIPTSGIQLLLGIPPYVSVKKV